MRVVIVGAGVVGFHLAAQLSREGHDISIIDSSADLVRSIEEKMDVMAISGDASLPSVLRRAGAHEAELVIAVTDSDTTNLVVSLISKKMGARKCIVRVRSREFSVGTEALTSEDVGADLMINSIDITAQQLERMVRNPGATDVSEFADGDLFLWGFTLSEHSALAGVRLRELKERHGNLEALIVAIQREDGTIVIPTGDDALRPGDNIYVFIRRRDTKKFRELVHPEEENIGKVVIVGAGRIGIELARRLEGRIKSVYLVDADREAAEAASELLSKTTILCGDAVDPDFAAEYDIMKADYFLALTDDDQTNLMNGLLVKKQSSCRIAVLAQQPQYVEVLQTLGIDVVVNPRLQTVSEILAHIRRGRILHVTRIGETGAEASEYIAAEGCAIVGKPLKSVGMPRGSIMSAIIREGRFEVPGGDSIVEPGDHVVILALPEAVAQVDRLFSKKRVFRGSRS